MSTDIALLCMIYPASVEKKNRVLHLLNNGYSYRDPAAQCTTWNYFTPSTRPKAANMIVDASGIPDPRNTMVGGMEIYTDKAALSTQLKDPDFQKYHSLVKNEQLYAKPEELVVWYPRGGFVARDSTAPPHGPGTIVMVAKFILRDDALREAGLKILRPFADWVKANEPDVLTYSIMTRPKAVNEILMYERYKNPDALKKHGSSKEFRAMFKQIKPLVKGTVMNEWEEIEGSFVGNVLGGGPTSKL